MASQNPYWGELPAPKVSRGNSVKQPQEQRQRGEPLHVDTQAKGERLSSQSQSRANRYSNLTDAQTTSTQSPYGSPTASDFHGDGLAPRPSSYQRKPNDSMNNDEFYERRRRRQSRNREQFGEESSGALPPAAPEVPRGPPLSYRPPNGAVRQSGPPIRSVKQSEIVATNARLEGHDGRRRRESYPAGEEATGGPTGKEVARERLNGHSARTPQRGDSTRSRQTDLSPAQAEARKRKEWASDRSPLQRLEVTLDDITKEEKRARVQEAELLARESKAGRGGGRANQGSVRSRNRPVDRDETDGHMASEPSRNAGTRNDQPARGNGSDARKQAARRAEVHQDYEPEYEPGQDVISTTSRNVVEPVEQRSPRARPTTTQHFASGALPAAGVVRSTSNKLKKKPPQEYQEESRYPPTVEQLRRNEIAPDKNVTRSVSSSGPRRETKYNANKELPPPPPQGAQRSSQPLDDTFSDEDLASPAVRRGNVNKVERLTGQKFSPDGQAEYQDDEQYGPPVRRGTISKIERLLGQKPKEDQPLQSEEQNVTPTRKASLFRRLTGSKRVPQSPQSARGSNEPAVVKVDGVMYDIPPTGAAAPEESEALSHEIQARKGHRHLHLSDVLYRHEQVPGQTSYLAGPRLDEWRKGGVALLAGPLLDLDDVKAANVEVDKTWWETDANGKRKTPTKTRKAEAYDGEYDEKIGPTRFKPALFLKSGPLLRYCGIRKDKQTSSRKTAPVEREVWRGSIMIVTQDSISSYDLAPTLRLFVQPLDLMPPPPEELKGEELAPEYIDPLAGLTKIGRDGRTLYIRPVDHLEEGVDLSQEESDEGLFEMHKSPLDGVGEKKPPLPKPQFDGERAGKYKEVRGFRLHAEQGVTFWRFNIEVELRDKQQRIAYRINRGPATAFWVPAKNQAMNIMFSSCNGFSHDIDPNKFSGPDPMWRDVLNTHQTRPFHVMLGGGDQLYNDPVMDETILFKEWLGMHDPVQKSRVPFTPEMQVELEEFYLNRYAMWFSQGLFSVANSQIPMINIYDDHDIIDGFGSYPDHYMKSPIMSGLGAVAYKYYMLFQHQSSIDELEANESSWIIGSQPGPYMNELSRSVFTQLGTPIAFLGLDCRTERMNDEIVSADTYHKVFDRLEKDIIKGTTKHLIVMVGVPMAYPRMVWLENILTSRAIAPLKAMGRAGWFGKGLLNKFDGGVEVLDDLDDHWTARHHKEERNWFIQELQDLAAEKSVRVTLLGGDVHLGAVGQFYSNPKLGIPKDKDFRYMPNIISSAIVNTPPPNTLADILNRRNKVHHLDEVTDEDMIPIFTQDVNGKPRNNKRLLNRRNWCSIRAYDPSFSPPSTPESEDPQTPPLARGLLRRFSSNKGPSYRPDLASPTAPPLSNQGFFGRRKSVSQRSSIDSERPGRVTRSLSLTRKDFMPGLFKRNSKKQRRDEINGYGSETDEEYYSDEHQPTQPPVRGIRGGSGGPTEDEPSYFPPMPRRSTSLSQSQAPSSSTALQRTPFHRTPTGLSTKQAAKHAGKMDINLEGGLDICLNMEVNQRDPAGITVPYRLLIPALWYGEWSEKTIEDVKKEKEDRPGGLQRLMSLGGGSKRYKRREVEVSSSESEGGTPIGTPGGSGGRGQGSGQQGVMSPAMKTAAPVTPLGRKGAQKWY